MADSEVMQDELTVLKERADLMGIEYGPNIGVATLRERINQKLAPAGPKSKTAEQLKREHQNDLRKEANRLVRVRITCMDPAKKNWPGEILTVSNSVVGTVKKYVPYQDNEDGYHIPNIIYLMMRDRKYQAYKTERNAKGQKIKKTYLASSYALELLKPLTPDQLKDLAQRQALNHSIDKG